MSNSKTEYDIAVMEGDMNQSEDRYFKARPQIDTGHCRHLFCAGFERGWKARAQHGADSGKAAGIVKHNNDPRSDNPEAIIEWLFGGDEINLPHGTKLYIKPPANQVPDGWMDLVRCIHAQKRRHNLLDHELVSVAVWKQEDHKEQFYAQFDFLVKDFAQPDAGAGQCEWQLADKDHGIWEAPCGACWSFIDGGPAENEVKFCPHCGKPLTVQPPQTQGEE